MADPTLELFHFPGACSRVTVCALEMAELPYTLRLVNLAGGEQMTPEYKKVNPLGKVPLLRVDGVSLSENAAIITYIATLRPDAGIFPRDPSPRQRAEVIGAMSFCGGTVHPSVRGMLNPQRVTSGETEGVKAKSRELLEKAYHYAEDRMAANGWWLGDDVSIADVYLDWTISAARIAGFDFGDYPALDGLADRLTAIPPYLRMQEEERQSRKALGL